MGTRPTPPHRQMYPEQYAHPLAGTTVRVVVPGTMRQKEVLVERVYRTPAGREELVVSEADGIRFYPLENVVAGDSAQKPVACRRCSECVGMSHHWLLDMLSTDDEEFQPGDFACKHCDQRGDECTACDGGGCGNCDHEGVVPIETAPQQTAKELP